MSTLHCDYCGLPVPSGWTTRPVRAVSASHSNRTSEALETAPVYCCLGCRFAASVAAANGPEGLSRTLLTRLGLSIFLTMNVMVFTMALWSKDVYDFQPASPSYSAFVELMRYGCLLFSAPVLLMLGIPLVAEVGEQLRRRVVTTDLLLVVGVAAAFAYSSIAVVLGRDHVYFEVGCVILVAVTLGRWLEATGKWKTTEALRSLSRLLPGTAHRMCQAVGGDVVSGDEVCGFDPSLSDEIDVERLRAGDLIRVLPGERMPCDGVIHAGRAVFDEQVLTGESVPRAKEPGDDVYGGTLNTDGDLVVRVGAAVRDGALQRLIDAVARAIETKGREQRLADRIARWFLPLVFVVAAGTVTVHGARDGLGEGVLRGLAVVLIACPCALGVATPLAIWAAMGNAAQRGVLFRDGDALSRLASVRAVCFDKTGTLTTGDCDVEALVLDDAATEGEVRRAAGSVASCSQHSLSQAIARFANAPVASAMAAKAIPGRGVAAQAPGIVGDVLLGSQELMNDFCLRWPAKLRQAASRRLSAGFPIACVGWANEVRGLFVLRETERAETLRAVERLKQMGLRLEILSGDHSQRAGRLAKSLGLAAYSAMLPDDKRAAIERLRATTGPVAMVGDGINDAPALAAADVGIALACGADVTRDAGDVCLLSNDLERIPWAIELSQRTVRTIRHNLFWAFAYNGVGVGLAAAGWLNPIFAAIAMVGSSLFVIANSLRLGRFAA